MSGRNRRLGAGAGLVGGTVAVALTLGLGSAHADAANQVVDISPASSADLLGVAITNFLDAKDVITGIDTSELSDEWLRAVDAIQRVPNTLDGWVTVVGDKIEPAESAILAHSGPLADLVDQLFFTPYNQQWADAGESMLGASHTFDGAVEAGSTTDAMSAAVQMLGIEVFQLIPASIEALPITWIAGIFGDMGDMTALAGPDLFDFLF